MNESRMNNFMRALVSDMKQLELGYARSSIDEMSACIKGINTIVEDEDILADDALLEIQNIIYDFYSGTYMYKSIVDGNSKMLSTLKRIRRESRKFFSRKKIRKIVEEVIGEED